jgi:hypothetical protein
LICAVLERSGIDLVDYGRFPPVAVLKKTFLNVKMNRKLNRDGGGGVPPKTVYDLCTTGIFSDIRARKPLFVCDIRFHQIIINLSVHALMVLAIFCFLVDEKIKLKVLTCSLLILKILPVTRFKDPYVAMLTLKMHTESPL